MNEVIGFLLVGAITLVSASVLVSLYSLGLRLLTTAGRIPSFDPAEFTGAITVLGPKRAKRQAKRAKKAAKANPLTPGQKLVALVGAYSCFVLCVAAVLVGVYLIVPALHG